MQIRFRVEALQLPLLVDGKIRQVRKALSPKTKRLLQGEPTSLYSYWAATKKKDINFYGCQKNKNNQTTIKRSNCNYWRFSAALLALSWMTRSPNSGWPRALKQNNETRITNQFGL